MIHRMHLAAILTIFVAASFALGQSATTPLPKSCKQVSAISLPAEAATLGAVKQSPDCASYKWYRGIGREQNLSLARQCAWTERAAQLANLPQNPNEPTAWVVGGGLILADIYWNGAGVDQNRPLAIQLICENDAELANLALDELRKNPKLATTTRAFEFCDYATTTFTMGFCTGYKSEIQQSKSADFERTLAAKMSPSAQAAFAKLQAARDAYITAHASEVDQGGSIRAMRTLSSQQMLRDQFHADLLHFENATTSPKSTKDFDALLAQSLAEKSKALAAQTEESIGQGAVTSDGLQQAQSAWELYRTAWLNFAQQRYPAKLEAVRQQITKERYLWIKSIPVY